MVQCCQLLVKAEFTLTLVVLDNQQKRVGGNSFRSLKPPTVLSDYGEYAALCHNAKHSHNLNYQHRLLFGSQFLSQCSFCSAHELNKTFKLSD